jgi:nitrite reductase/ring-hydroxylating ferredoxin subunit
VDPYHYLRRASSPDPNLLVIGGKDHRTADVDDEREHVRSLEAYVRERFDVEAIESIWTHEFYEPTDGLPFIGRLAGHERTYVATGLSGDGLKFGLVAADVFAHLIEGRPHALEKLLSPSRFQLRAEVGELAAGGAHVAKHAVVDHLAFADVDNVDEIEAGEGALCWVRGRRRAVYRDPQRQLHVMSPICTHARCVVQWNRAAKTWDCPCHGGRYDAHGRVIMGPPKFDLSSPQAEVGNDE